MSYDIPDFEEIRNRILRDTRNFDRDAHITPDSDHYIRASATASAVEGLYDHQSWIARQIFPDTSDSEFLEVHARLRGIVRKPATRATGHVIISGLSGSVVPLGTQIKDAQGALYVTTQHVVLTSETASHGEQLQVMQVVACQAQKPGLIPSCQDVLAKLVAPPIGVDTNVLLTISGGSNVETDASLLARLLDYMRDPPGGGTALDYKRWAMDVPGVSKAYVYPLRRGIGTVDIVITGENGTPSTEVITMVQSHIDTMRPVTARSAVVFAATPFIVNMEVGLALSGSETLQTILPVVKDALQHVYNDYEPGSGVVLSHLIAALTSVPGVSDAVIISPESNIAANPVKIPILGEVTLRGL